MRAVVPFIILLLAATACGTQEHPPSRQIVVSSPSATPGAQGSRPPAPTAGELEAQLRAAIDPALPDSDRAQLVEDGQAFVGTLPDLYAALRANPQAKYGISQVFDNRDGTLTAVLKLDKDGTGNAVRTATVHFLAIGGRWRLSRVDLCGILRSQDYIPAPCR